MATILNLLGKSELVEVGLLVHGLSVGGNIDDGIGGEIALRARNPVLLVEILGVDNLSLGLSSPEDANQTRVAVVGRTNVPARVAIAPETHIKGLARGRSGHGSSSGGLAGNALSLAAGEFSRQAVGVIRRLGDPVTIVDLVAWVTIALLDALKI